MNRRERIMLMVAVVLLGGIIYKFLIHDPKQAEYQSLVAVRDATAAELTRDQQVVARAEASRREYDRMRAHIAAIEQKLPQTKEIPALLTAMESFTKQVGVTFQSIRPAQLIPIVAAASPGAPRTGATGAAPARAGAPAPAAVKQLNYSSMGVDLTISGTFAQVVEYLRGLRQFPRLVIVDSVSVAPAGVPKLGVNIHSTIFTLGTPADKSEEAH
jgi:Tfp pilus assembly protein PilO